MEDNTVAIIVGALLISGLIGALIGRDRKIGSGGGFILGLLLGILGWIIAALSQADVPTKDDIKKMSDESNSTQYKESAELSYNGEDNNIYDTLYDELIDKCSPNNFLEEAQFNSERFNKANQIYAELLSKKQASDNNLIDLRDKAIDELGIHFSTKKKYDYLMQFLDPKLYIEPSNLYDAERVAEASKYYTILVQNKTDIKALEQLESLASNFIAKGKADGIDKKAKKLKKKNNSLEMGRENEKKNNIIAALVILLIGVIFVLIGIYR